jgi:hypothetical protein
MNFDRMHPYDEIAMRAQRIHGDGITPGTDHE